MKKHCQIKVIFLQTPVPGSAPSPFHIFSVLLISISHYGSFNTGFIDRQFKDFKKETYSKSIIKTYTPPYLLKLYILVKIPERADR